MPPKPKPLAVSGPFNVPDITPGKPEIDAAVKAASASVAKKMGVPQAKLPKSVQNAIATAVKAGLNQRAKSLVYGDVQSVVKDQVFKGVKPLAALDSRLTAAKQGIAHVAANVEVDNILQETANLLFKKFQAFQRAGFSDAQAFDILISEVKGRAARNR